MKINNITKIVAGLFLAITVSSCVKDDNSPGYEYMPDMYRSPAIEAYVDYGEVRDWRPTDSLKNRLTALQPPVGAIPYSGTDANELSLPYKRFPSIAMIESHSISSEYYSETDYDESVNDLSPLAYNKINAEKGKVLYERFCDHCHGEKGAGDGKVSNNDNINPPANAFAKPEGQMFYSITYGKGVMGAHASQINKKERWEIIQYLKVLNNGGKFPEEQTTEVSLTDALKDLAAHANDKEKTSLAISNLEFNVGSAILDLNKSANSLELLTNFMKDNNLSILLSGHTDDQGNLEENLKLSKDRAIAVKEYLVSKGISVDRIEAKGYGSSKPKASNDSEEGKALNRRTEVTIK